MGPQIPTLTFTVESEVMTQEDIIPDPLEFASSYLMLYGVPTSENFTTVQALVSAIAT